MGNQRGGLLLSNPFPPLGTVLIVPDLPLSLAPAAVFAYSSVCLDPAGRLVVAAAALGFDGLRGRDVDYRIDHFLRDVGDAVRPPRQGRRGNQDGAGPKADRRQ